MPLIEDFDNDRNDFPQLVAFDGEDNLIIPDHGMRLRNLMLAESEIMDCKLYGQFRDDGLPCYNMSVTVNQEEIKFSIWCVEDSSLLFAFARAPFLPEDHKRVVAFLLKATDPFQDIF